MGSPCPEEPPQKFWASNKMFRFTIICIVAIWSFLINCKIQLFEANKYYQDKENIHGGSHNNIEAPHDFSLNFWNV